MQGPLHFHSFPLKTSAAPGRPAAAMQQHTSLPGTEFYEERLARARALPKAERSADVRQWLRMHAELQAALAALPGFPATATPERPLVEPLGGDAALAALLRYIAAAYSESTSSTVDSPASLQRLAPQLPPFYRVWQEGGREARSAVGRSYLHPFMLLLIVQPAFAARARATIKAAGPLSSKGAVILLPPGLAGSRAVTL